MNDVTTPNSPTGSNPELQPIQLMLVDADPVFRLGLKVWLDQQSDFVVVAEAGSANEALGEVRSRRKTNDFHAALENHDAGELVEAGPAGCDSDKCLMPEKKPN